MANNDDQDSPIEFDLDHTLAMHNYIVSQLRAAGVSDSDAPHLKVTARTASVQLSQASAQALASTLRQGLDLACSEETGGGGNGSGGNSGGHVV